MAEVHITVAVILFGLNLFAGIWGVTAWLLRRPTTIFWYLLRGAQISVGLQAILGLMLLMTDHKAVQNLHYVYGGLPLMITLVTETMRVGAAQHVVGDSDYERMPEAETRALALRIFIAETRVMALGCLIIAALALRAGMTSGGL